MSLSGRNSPAGWRSPAPTNVGPSLIEGAGHFIQWERAELLDGAIASFGRDLV